jgi:quinol monooxygenase YgiN
MYGTVARMKAKPGAFEALKNRVRDPDQTSGAVAVYVYQMDADPNELYMVAVFESKEAYRANAEKPETHEGYLEMMKHLEAEPEWNDGEVVWFEQF